MIKKYDNVYTDVSFTLYNEHTWPTLKVLMYNDKKLRNRVLFGTDYYVVAEKGTERELSMKFRAFMGEELFKQMAIKNVEDYLRQN
jgi:predicted TIM-barrel fold metal-dependent hydrolase